MNTLSILDHFCLYNESQREAALPGEYEVITPGGPHDAWPLYATAAVLLTGTVATLEPQDLNSALLHFRRKLESGDATMEEWEEESKRVLWSMMSWADQYEARMCDRPPLPEFSLN